MLQTNTASIESFYRGEGQSLGLEHYLGILKRRYLYFAIPFIAILLVGAFVTAIQRPIYEAKGKILVQSQDIPTDLVRPTVMETANERIHVIQQRILTRDNLLGVVEKNGMFARERRWMSGTEILDLMREQTKFELVDINASRGGPSTIAFTVSFEYYNPEATLKVVNDLLTLILKEDASNRTNRAMETTNFLSRESQRLLAELAAIEAQIAEKKINPKDGIPDTADPARLQVTELTKLKEELAQKSSVYSAEYPAVKALKKKVAAMERLIAQTPPREVTQTNAALIDLFRKQVATAKNLEDTNKKLEEARLGEKLERDQQSERLQVIEQPILPQKPIKPKRTKLLAMTLMLAMAAGVGAVFAAESLNSSIRYAHQLDTIANGILVVSIPYIETRAEAVGRKRRLAVVVGLMALAAVLGLLIYLFFGPPIDLSGIDQAWLDRIRNLSK